MKVKKKYKSEYKQMECLKLDSIKLQMKGNKKP